MSLGPRQGIESQRQQAIANQDRSRLVERLVNGRPASPQVVVVHGRQVVMDQRITMDAFKRGSRHHGVPARHSEERGCLYYKKRTQALARSKARVTHGFEQSRGPLHFLPRGARGEQIRERDFGILGDPIEAFPKLGFHGVLVTEPRLGLASQLRHVRASLLPLAAVDLPGRHSIHLTPVPLHGSGVALDGYRREKNLLGRASRVVIQIALRSYRPVRT